MFDKLRFVRLTCFINHREKAGVINIVQFDGIPMPAGI
jgi:hypothetical protein